MKYEVLRFRHHNISNLQKVMNEFFEKYSDSIEVVDISYHTETYDMRFDGSEYSKSGSIDDRMISVLMTVKNLSGINLSE